MTHESVEVVRLSPSREGVLAVSDVGPPRSILVEGAERVRRVDGPLQQVRSLTLRGGAAARDAELGTLLAPFAEAHGLHYLGVHDFLRMEHFSGLEVFAELEHLSLLQTTGRLDTLAASVRRRLQRLNISGDLVSDVQALSECSSIKRLSIDDGDLKNDQWTVVSTLRSLESVALVMSRNTRLARVIGGLDLLDLELRGSTVDSLECLADLPPLCKLNISGLRGKYALSDLAGAPRLEWLEMSSLKPKNIVHSAEPIGSLVNLEVLFALDVAFAPESLSVLRGLEKLRICQLHRRYRQVFPGDARFRFY